MHLSAPPAMSVNDRIGHKEFSLSAKLVVKHGHGVLMSKVGLKSLHFTSFLFDLVTTVCLAAS